MDRINAFNQAPIYTPNHQMSSNSTISFKQKNRLVYDTVDFASKNKKGFLKVVTAILGSLGILKIAEDTTKPEKVEYETSSATEENNIKETKQDASDNIISLAKGRYNQALKDAKAEYEESKLAAKKEYEALYEALCKETVGKKCDDLVEEAFEKYISRASNSTSVVEEAFKKYTSRESNSTSVVEEAFKKYISRESGSTSVVEEAFKKYTSRESGSTSIIEEAFKKRFEKGEISYDEYHQICNDANTKFNAIYADAHQKYNEIKTKAEADFAKIKQEAKDKYSDIKTRANALQASYNQALKDADSKYKSTVEKVKEDYVAALLNNVNEMNNEELDIFFKENKKILLETNNGKQYLESLKTENPARYIEIITPEKLFETKKGKNYLKQYDNDAYQRLLEESEKVYSGYSYCDPNVFRRVYNGAVDSANNLPDEVKIRTSKDIERYLNPVPEFQSERNMRVWESVQRELERYYGVSQ